MLGRGGFAALFGPNSVRQRLTIDQPFVLRPMKLVLGRTRERVSLPFSADGECFAARIEETVQGVPFRNDSQFRGQRAPGGVV
jgi:hypothetical protein